MEEEHSVSFTPLEAVQASTTWSKFKPSRAFLAARLLLHVMDHSGAVDAKVHLEGQGGASVFSALSIWLWKATDG